MDIADGLLIWLFEASLQTSLPIQYFMEAFPDGLQRQPFDTALGAFDPAFWIATPNLEKKYVVINNRLQFLVKSFFRWPFITYYFKTSTIKTYLDKH